MSIPISGEVFFLQPDNIIDLYDLDLSPIGVNEVIRFTTDTQTNGNIITYRGHIYDSVPITISGLELSNKAPFPTPIVRIANGEGTISALMFLFQDLVGAKLTRRRTFVKYLDGSHPWEFPTESYFVERKTTENSIYVEFQLTSGIQLNNTQLPGRIISRRCKWEYRGVDCGYTGTAYFDIYDNPTLDQSKDVCAKRVKSCKLRFGANAELPFEGIPTVDIG